MARTRSHIGISAVITLVSLLGTTATPLARACCTWDAAEVGGCSHHDGVRRTPAAAQPTEGEACPMHRNAEHPEDAGMGSVSAAHLCGCTAGADITVRNSPELLTLSHTVAPLDVAPAVDPALIVVPLQRLRVPPLPPPRVSPS
jgi:hypothetical protein